MENINKLTLVTPSLQDKSPYKNILEGGWQVRNCLSAIFQKLQLHALTVTSSDREYWRTKWL